METTWVLGAALLGFLTGAAVHWLALRGQLAGLTRSAAEAGAELSQAKEERAGFQAKAERADQLCEELRAREEHIHTLIAQVNEARARMEAFEEQKREFEKKVADVFASLSNEALDKNTERFLSLASQRFENLQTQARGDLGKLVTPFEEKLKSFDQRIGAIQKDWIGASELMREQVRNLSETQTRLQAETNNLVRALRNPAQRGQWGEMQLETILKHAGLQEGVHYRKQESKETEGGRSRPDFLVMFPNGQQIVIDSKVPLDAYYEAHVCPDDDTRVLKLKEHAKCVRQHALALGRRSYQDKFEAFDFVVMFLPAESLFSVAVEHDATLLEFGVENRVFLASPITLLGMLRSVAMGWRQEQLAENAKKISDEARDLYESMRVLGGHFERLGKRLDGAVEAYNASVGSLEMRVLPKARRFKELRAATGDDIGTLEPIERTAREMQSPELRPLPGAAVEVEEEVLPNEDAESEGSNGDGKSALSQSLFSEKA
jgi:DNA recombination protein RmuC